MVYSPTNRQETAWAEGDYKFTDKDWGWYDIYYYNQPPNKFTILYGTACTNDTLKLFHIDMTNGKTDLIMKEFVGTGAVDAAAYDETSGMFLFAKGTTQELWGNQMKDLDPSFSLGSLNGIAYSATFYNGFYYYVDQDINSINKVTFNSNWSVASEIVLDTIPSTVRINDIAMSPDGSTLYMLGEVNGGSRELISWNPATETFYTMAINVTSGGQIAFGSDGQLYAVAPIVEGGSHSAAYVLDPSTGTMTEIDDDVIIIDDPFSDLSQGPIM